MKSLFFGVIFSLAVTSLFAQVKNPYLVTEKSWGAITQSTGFEGLKKIYGTANVKDDISSGAEGVDTIPVTVVYPESNKTFTIYWKDGNYHKAIAMIETFGEKNPYITSSSVKVGSPLQKLLQMNGKKIKFSGLGWDYGGIIQSYNGGKLEKSNISYNLDSKGDISQQLYGDRDLNTDMAIVKKNLTRLVVSTIRLAFPD